MMAFWGELGHIIGITFRVDSDEAKRRFREVKNETASYGRELGALGSIFSSLKTAAVGFLAALSIKTIAEYTIKFAQMSASVERARVAFDFMARKRGADPVKLFKDIERAAGGVIDDLDLLTIANRSLAQDIPHERLAEFIELSRKAARVMGVEEVYAIELLSDSVARMSVKQLKTYGITLDVKEITEELGDEYETSAAKAKFFMEMMDAMNAQFGDMQSGFSDSIAATKHWDIALGDLGRNLGRIFDPIVTHIIEENFVKPVREAADWVDELRIKIEALKKEYVDEKGILVRLFQFLRYPYALPTEPPAEQYPYISEGFVGPPAPIPGKPEKWENIAWVGGTLERRGMQQGIELATWRRLAAENIGTIVPEAAPPLDYYQTQDQVERSIDEELWWRRVEMLSEYEREWEELGTNTWELMTSGAMQFEGTMLTIIHNIDEGFSHLAKSIVAEWSAGILSRLLSFGLFKMLSPILPGGQFIPWLFGFGGIPKAQHGLIVNGPQLVMAGEAGKEAIVPLEGPEARRLGGTHLYFPYGAFANEIEFGRRVKDILYHIDGGPLSTSY